MTRGQSIWGELRERRVFRVSLVYLALGWGGIEAASTLEDVLDLPDFVARLIFGLVLAGFPVAVFCAWAFQITPEGIRRSAPLQQGRLRFFAGLAAFTIAFAGCASLAYLVSLADFEPGEAPDVTAGSIPLDPNAVAVMPFRVNAPEELAYLGSGFMDLLSAGLTGEVGPRSVHPGAVEQATSAAGYDPADVARTLGASFYVTGSVTGNASGITVKAELIRGENREVAATESASGVAGEISEIAEQLLIQLLSLSSGEDRASIASLTSTSPEALKLYLLGKRNFAEGNYEAGATLLDQALELDPTFALAAIARADASIMILGGKLSDEQRAFSLAWENRSRLSDRDLAYLEARYPQESLTAAERIEAYAKITQSQPTRIEGWFWLFEEVWHAPGLFRDESYWPRITAIANRALQLHPKYHPIIAHLVYAQPEKVSREERISIYQQYLALDNVEPMFTDGMLDAMIAGGNHLRLDPAAIATTNRNSLINAPLWPFLLTELTPDDYLNYVDRALEEHAQRAATESDRQLSFFISINTNFGLGRFSLAEAALTVAGVIDRMVASSAQLRIYLSLLNLQDRAYGEEWVNESASSLAATAPANWTLEEVRLATAVEVWRYERDSDYVNPGAGDLVRAVVPPDDRVAQLQLAGHAAFLDAWAAIRAGEPAAGGDAIDTYLQIVAQGPPGDITLPTMLLPLAAALEELGDDQRALEVLYDLNWTLASVVFYPRAYLARARIEEKLGDICQASHNYRNFLKLRRYADERQRPFLDQLRLHVEQLESTQDSCDSVNV